MWRSLVFLLSLASLVSCGFTLRMESPLASYAGLHVSESVPHELRLALERHSRESNIDWIEKETENAIKVSKIIERSSLRSTRVDSLGRVVEYWLSIRWLVSAETSEAHQIELLESTNIGISEDSLIGFDKERTRLERELRDQLTQSLMLRLALLNQGSE